MHYYKINIRLVLVAALLMSWVGIFVASPPVAAAVAQKYVTTCNDHLTDKNFCKNLKQKWIDACKDQWAPNGPTHQQIWIACISDKANLTDSSTTTTAPGAQGGIPGVADPAAQYKACQSPDDCNLVTRYVNPFINKFLVPMAGLAVVIGIIWGSIEYTTSGGDPQRVASGKGRIMKALIGLLAFIFLYAFLNWLIPGGLL